MDFSFARHNMVECQLRPNRVTDEALLAAISSLPRERFLPESLQSVAYADKNIQIAPDRYLLQPYVLGRLVQAAAPRSSDIALVVGCGSGFAAAVLSKLVETVFAVESDAALAASSAALLSELALDNVVVVEGALAEGLPDQGPFGVIVLNGAAMAVPDSLVGQLAEGGRLVAVVEDSSGVGRATLLQRARGGASHRTLFDATVPVLEEFRKNLGFVF